MDVLKNTADSLWQVMLVGLLLGAGLPAIFAFGLRALDSKSHSADGSIASTRSRLAVTAAVTCFAVVLIAIVTGILFIMKGFLSHTFGIEIF
ncbi:hypothetical protein [Rhodococcus sp. OK302]|uniref:hypothetical protein n=1 Tax=Rhodococcus sp. OK302 TaxID=1882769 RepID=UPI000B942281|nr:hypothetical protein [Rhodococcus sp. OK302]OYD70911.1 hypothetical protein BDB13_4554 [Rhodococcus sp. OK302]